ESAAILEYLQESYDEQQQFRPKDPADKAQYRYWMHYAEGSLMPLLVMQLVMTTVPKHTPLLIRPLAKEICAGVKNSFVLSRLKEHIQFLEHDGGAPDYVAVLGSHADMERAVLVGDVHRQSGQRDRAIHIYLRRACLLAAQARALVKEKPIA